MVFYEPVIEEFATVFFFLLVQVSPVLNYKKIMRGTSREKKPLARLIELYDYL